MKRISTVGPKSCGDWIGYVRPDQFLDHLTVIINDLMLDANVVDADGEDDFVQELDNDFS